MGLTKTQGEQPTHGGLETVHLSELTSKCASLAAPSRIDPYWGGQWALNSDAVWSSAKLAQSQQTSGIGHTPAALQIEEKKAVQNILSPRGWNQRLDLLSVVDSWRTVSAEQAAAFTGHRLLANPTTSGVPSLFAANILDLGAFSSGLFGTRTPLSNMIYRPSYSRVMEEEIIPHMTFAERVAVTGGYGWTSGGQYDRHNLLATELGLRVAEYLKVGTVLGEKMSTYDLLAGSGIGRQFSKEGAAKRADLTVVRPDGLRIAVEITASMSDNFDAKVRSWAKLLSERPLETSGLTVLFVAADHPEKIRANTDAGTSSVRGRIYAAIKRAVREFPGTSMDRIAARMGVATWREFFPASHVASERFMGLTADFALGAAGEKWKSVDMMDTVALPFSPSPYFDAEAVITNASHLGAVPHWLRTESGSDELLMCCLNSVGLDGIPMPAPARPSRTKGRRLGEGVGAAGWTLPPERILTR